MKHECPQWQQSPKLAIFSIKVRVKDTRSLTLVSFERVCMPNMKSLSLTVQKLWPGLKFLPQSHRVTDRVTDRSKTLDAPEFLSGGMKMTQMSCLYDNNIKLSSFFLHVNPFSFFPQFLFLSTKISLLIFGAFGIKKEHA